MNKIARFYWKQTLREGVKVKYPVGDFKHKHRFKAIVWEYLRSIFLKTNKTEPKKIKNYLIFFGNQRTGHTLIASLLDAHPEICISHELNALKYFMLGFSKNQVFNLIAENSALEAQFGRGESGYDYSLPKMSQGTSNKLQIIGDKDARRDTTQLLRYPEMIHKLKALGLSLKVIVIIRNPFDNIATICRRQHQDHIDEKSIRLFFEMASAVHEMLPEFTNDQLLLMRNEYFIEDSNNALKEIGDFLDVQFDDQYLRDATSIVWSSKSKSREKLPWSAEHIALVEENIKINPLFDGYDYHT